MSGDAARAIAHALDDCRVRNERTEVEFECMREGVERRFETRIVPYDRGRLLLVLRDVTERHRAANRIRELAFFDPLTQLPNRQYLLQLLEEARREAATTGERFAVVRINLDQFKRINDSIGHGAGDALLQAVASRLGTFLKLESDGAVTMPLARLAGDEFAVAIRHLQSDADVQNAINNITAAFASPYLIRHRDFFVTCTIGIAIFPDHGSFADELLRTAGLALHEAKTSGGNRGVIYSEHMRARSVARLELETELRRALEQNELFLVYQPQIEVATGRIASVEALVRWRHPTRGIVPPDEFIPIAEESGLIVPLSDLVMRQALKQISEWWQAGCRDLRVAVNVSGAQFEAPGFPDWVFAHLDEAGPARRLPRARDHREPADGRRSRGGAGRARGARARRARGHRRLRHRLLLARLSQALPHRSAEDRPLVRRRPRPRFERRRDLRGHHRHGPAARPQDRRRRRRDARSSCSSWPRTAARWRRASTSRGRSKRREMAKLLRIGEDGTVTHR